MRFPPPAVFESWPEPNYVNPTTRGLELFVFIGIFLLFATLAVGIRLYTRIVIRRWLGADDAFIVVSYFLNLVLVFVAMNGFIRLDWNKHMWDVRLSHFEPGGKYLFAFKIIWATTSASVRLSLLCFFYRLLGHIGLQRYRWILLFNFFFVSGIWICFVFTTVFDDKPIRAYWTFPPMVNTTELQESDSFTILSGFNTLSELFIASLPLPLVFGNRSLPLLQRWNVIGLLSLGFLVAVVGATRTYFAWLVFHEYDHTWWASPYLITSEVELDTALICACAPALRPFFGRLFGPPGAGGSPADGPLSCNNTRRPAIGIFNKLGSRFGSEKPRSQVSELSTNRSMKRVFDLEGIHTEGFGYKVTITADPVQAVDSVVRLRRKSMCSLRGKGRGWTANASDPEAGVPKWCLVKNPFSHRRATDPQTEDNIEATALRVHTTQSIEVRKSYHDSAALP